MFLVEGPAARDNLKAIGCPEEKIRIQHIGVNLNTYRYVERKPKQDGTIRILMAATFKEKKGLNYGLKAFSAAYRELPMLRLTVIGDGPMKEELLRIADDEKISSVITWFGYVEHEELLRHMMDCHIFMQPSVTASDGDTEGGLPVSMIEAAATGMPLLATYHADIPLVVKHGGNGRLSPERDAVALSQNLLWLASNAEHWGQMGRVGRQIVEENFDELIVYPHLYDRYRELLTDRQGLSKGGDFAKDAG
jgi:colanic acid/amylovoran biosynthesis glycosyltransferase